MKYKVYILSKIQVQSQYGYRETLVSPCVADFCNKCEYDSIEEAYDAIIASGERYVNYTILPYIYMT